jgi:hypothetical protein
MIVGIRPGGDVVADMGEQREQQIEPAVDLANGIDALARRHLRAMGIGPPRGQRVHPLPPSAVRTLFKSWLVQSNISNRGNMAVRRRIGNASGQEGKAIRDRLRLHRQPLRGRFSSAWLKRRHHMAIGPSAYWRNEVRGTFWISVHRWQWPG